MLSLVIMDPSVISAEFTLGNMVRLTIRNNYCRRDARLAYRLHGYRIPLFHNVRIVEL